MNDLHYYAAASKGFGDLLAAELNEIGAQNVRQQGTGVSFAGPLEIGYRACLWSRVASRILLRIGEFPVSTAEALYEGVQQTDWQEHLDPEGTLAIEFVGYSRDIRNSHFGALKVKDAIVDQFRTASNCDQRANRCIWDQTLIHVQQRCRSIMLKHSFAF